MCYELSKDDGLLCRWASMIALSELVTVVSFVPSLGATWHCNRSAVSESPNIATRREDGQR